MKVQQVGSSTLRSDVERTKVFFLRVAICHPPQAAPAKKDLRLRVSSSCIWEHIPAKTRSSEVCGMAYFRTNAVLCSWSTDSLSTGLCPGRDFFPDPTSAQFGTVPRPRGIRPKEPPLWQRRRQTNPGGEWICFCVVHPHSPWAVRKKLASRA